MRAHPKKPDVPRLTPGERLLLCRSRSGMTAQQAADAVHVHLQTYLRWEKDKNTPSYSTLRDLATVFEIPFDFLAEGKAEWITGEVVPFPTRRRADGAAAEGRRDMPGSASRGNWRIWKLLSNPAYRAA